MFEILQNKTTAAKAKLTTYLSHQNEKYFVWIKQKIFKSMLHI